MAGSCGGSSTFGARLPPTEFLLCVDGPPCCRSTAFPWCWAWPFEALSFDCVEPGRNEEADDEAESDGAASTGVVVDVDATGTEVSVSLFTAASSDVAEAAPEGDWLGEYDAYGRLPEALPAFNGDCGADWLDGCWSDTSSPTDERGSDVDDALCPPVDGINRAGFGAIVGFGGISAR